MHPRLIETTTWPEGCTRTAYWNTVPQLCTSSLFHITVRVLGTGTPCRVTVLTGESTIEVSQLPRWREFRNRCLTATSNGSINIEKSSKSVSGFRGRLWSSPGTLHWSGRFQKCLRAVVVSDSVSAIYWMLLRP